jgi:hypothetical protein
MDTHALDERILARRGKRRRALLAILLSSSLATLGAGAMSLAVFTDSEATTGQWTTGTIILGVQPVAGFTVLDVMPGDTGAQTITVENNGTAELRYAMSSVGSGALADQIQMDVIEGACPGTGATISSGNASASAFGSNAQGAQAGDRVLAAGATEDLCFSWSLALGTGNAFQGVTGSVDYTFDAEQTDNNP